MGIILVFVLIGVILFLLKLNGIDLVSNKSSYSNGSEKPIENSMWITDQKNQKNTMTVYVFLAGWIIKKNTKDSKAKIQFIHAYFKQTFSAEHPDIGDEMANALKNSIHMRSVSGWVIRKLKTSEERIRLLLFLIDLSFVDGDIVDREYVALIRFGELIGIQKEMIDSWVNERRDRIEERKRNTWTNRTVGSYSQKRLNCFKILGVKESSSLSEIKKAFRLLAMRYHPDKLQQSSNTDKENATQKYLEIQEAYDFLVENEL